MEIRAPVDQVGIDGSISGTIMFCDNRQLTVNESEREGGTRKTKDNLGWPEAAHT